MAIDIDNEVAVDQQVYLAADIQRMLGIGKSKSIPSLKTCTSRRTRRSKSLKSVSFSEYRSEDSMNG